MKNILLAAFMVALIVCTFLGVKALQVGSVALCENLYWQPNAIEKMENHSCDFDKIEKNISNVQSGKY